MGRISLWQKAFGGLAVTVMTLSLVAVAAREPLHLSSSTARTLLDGVMAVLALVMVGAAHWVLRQPRR